MLTSIVATGVNRRSACFEPCKGRLYEVAADRLCIQQTRGGQGLFKWSDVAADTQRENYLVGHPLPAKSAHDSPKLNGIVISRTTGSLSLRACRTLAEEQGYQLVQ
jgi:hypothetical protein